MGLRRPVHAGNNGRMRGRSRERVFSDRVRGAKISAQHAREHAKKAIREADAAECVLWSEQMEGFGGPAQPSPTIAQCLNGGYGWLEVMCRRCRNPRQPAARCHPPATRHADLEIGGGVEMPFLRDTPLRAAGSSDQAYHRAQGRALSLGSSRRRALKIASTGTQTRSRNCGNSDAGNRRTAT